MAKHRHRTFERFDDIKGNPTENWSMAFDTCRERDCPTNVEVLEAPYWVMAVVFPSGYCKELGRRRATEETERAERG